jgi:hypothetical protein
MQEAAGPMCLAITQAPSDYELMCYAELAAFSINNYSSLHHSVFESAVVLLRTTSVADLLQKVLLLTSSAP